MPNKDIFGTRDNMLEFKGVLLLPWQSGLAIEPFPGKGYFFCAGIRTNGDRDPPLQLPALSNDAGPAVDGHNFHLEQPPKNFACTKADNKKVDK